MAPAVPVRFPSGSHFKTTEFSPVWCPETRRKERRKNQIRFMEGAVTILIVTPQPPKLKVDTQNRGGGAERG